MTNPTRLVQCLRKDGTSSIGLPAPWAPDSPSWLQQRGRTVVLVVDDQIQALADLSDEDALRHRIRDPLNIEFVFCPECAQGHALARDQKWFDRVADRIRQMERSLGAIFLDIMFEDESDPLRGSGIRFLSRLAEIVPRLPVLIMTQARDEQKLHEALARSGLHLEFFQKDAADRVGTLCRFLCEYAWLADPRFCAYSKEMREAIAALRKYAINRPRLEATDFPQPILFTAASGEGKTHAARAAARWLLEVEPLVRPNQNIQELDCNTLDRGQGAKIRLFGRGPQSPSERPDATGLVVRGQAQLASHGILIIDELGNSDLGFQDMLLTFVETGRADPEFRSNNMTQEATGPLDVMCIFTAQPVHIERDEIKADLTRRYARGTTISIPRLRLRPSDVVPMFYQTLRSCRRRSSQAWQEPEEIDTVFLPEAQEWLNQAVMYHDLSASELADLASRSEAQVLGIPYIEHQLRQILQTRPRSHRPVGLKTQSNRATDEHSRSERDVIEREPLSSLLANVDALELVHQLGEEGSLRFVRDADRLRGLLSDVQAAAAGILLPYLEACADIVRGGKEDINVTGTYKFVSGTEKETLNTARTRLKDILLVSRDDTMRSLRRSDLLAQLAIRIAEGKRSEAIRQMLQQLYQEPGQAERLGRLGWKQP